MSALTDALRNLITPADPLVTDDPTSASPIFDQTGQTIPPRGTAADTAQQVANAVGPSQSRWLEPGTPPESFTDEHLTPATANVAGPVRTVRQIPTTRAVIARYTFAIGVPQLIVPADPRPRLVRIRVFTAGTIYLHPIRPQVLTPLAADTSGYVVVGSSSPDAPLDFHTASEIWVSSASATVAVHVWIDYTDATPVLEQATIGPPAKPCACSHP